MLALPVEPAVEDLEPLRFLLHRLAGALADQLAARGMATARVHLRLTLETTFAARATQSLMALEQRLPEPTAEAEAIERLLLARLERTPPPAPVDRLELELAEGSRRRPVSSSRCSCPRRRGRRGSAGSSRGWP